MAGAVALAGMAALRSGAGLVTVGVPAPCLETVACLEPSFMTVPLPSDAGGRLVNRAREAIEDLASAATAVGCGPGLGRSSELDDLVGWIHLNVTKPVIFDADALNALANQSRLLTKAAGPRVLTPHLGEFRRLVGSENLAMEEARQQAMNFAAANNVVLVLKGHRSIITDGELITENTTGNPGMATGGSGDVLTGIITALLGQQMQPVEAARLGTYLHGLSGDLGAGEIGEVSLIASDLVRFLSAAFLQCPRHDNFS